ncbi:MAG: PIN domain-containing protein [Candidatus Zixiibacteriota bacterium]
MRVVVDANVLLAAITGKKTRKIFLIETFKFITTERTSWEVKKYVPEFARKLAQKLRQQGIKTDETQIEALLYERLDNLPLIALQEREYKDHLSLAEKLIYERDPNDVDILALTLELRVPRIH